MSAFQQARGLPADGVCDRVTWMALVEASWELGDRTLYLRVPNLRGDDVAELQRQLGRLGFDPGRVDGIFGPNTAAALAEFQRNVELTPADGICGADTVQALRRLSGRAVAGPAVHMVREYERLSHGERTLLGRRVVVGQLGGLSALARTLARALRVAGSSVLVLEEPDGARQAAAANRFRADVYLGLTTAEAGRIAFYATADFESLGGHQLAEQLHAELTPVLPVPGRRATRDAASRPPGDEDARRPARARADPPRRRPEPGRRRGGGACPRPLGGGAGQPRPPLTSGRGFVHRVVPSCA